MIDDAVTSRCSPVDRSLRKIHPAFVNKDETTKSPAKHSSFEPSARGNHVRAVLLRCPEGPFFRVMPIRPSCRHMVVSLTETPVSSQSTSRRTFSVASGYSRTSCASRSSAGPVTRRSRPGGVPGSNDPVRSIANRSFRTQLALTSNLRATSSDEGSLVSSSRIRTLKSADSGFTPSAIPGVPVYGKTL